MTFPKTLELRGWGPKLEGVGEQLTLVIGGAVRSKVSTDYRWRGDVRVTVDRWFVRQLCQAIADMQRADRARLTEELVRLSTELAPLTNPTTKE